MALYFLFFTTLKQYLLSDSRFCLWWNNTKEFKKISFILEVELKHITLHFEEIFLQLEHEFLAENKTIYRTVSSVSICDFFASCDDDYDDFFYVVSCIFSQTDCS